MRWFDPVGWLRLAQAERVQHRRRSSRPCCGCWPRSRSRTTTCRRCGGWSSGSAPLPAEMREQWARRVPHVELVEGYGCTETAALATHDAAPAHARAGSVGCAAPGVEVRIERRRTARTRRPESTARSASAAPSLMTGYWHDPDATAAAMRDGWFHTGDVGHLDADGYLFIVDRLKDLIIRGGFNVYPRDVEEALMRHPDVAVCAVVGRPDERVRRGGRGVRPAPRRAPRPPPATSSRTRREHMSAVKYPREVRIVDAMPLTSDRQARPQGATTAAVAARRPRHASAGRRRPARRSSPTRRRRSPAQRRPGPAPRPGWLRRPRPAGHR